MAVVLTNITLLQISGDLLLPRFHVERPNSHSKLQGLLCVQIKPPMMYLVSEQSAISLLSSNRRTDQQHLAERQHDEIVVTLLLTSFEGVFD